MPLVPEVSRSKWLDKASQLGWVWGLAVAAIVSLWIVLHSIIESFKEKSANNPGDWALSIFSGMPRQAKNGSHQEFELEFVDVWNHGNCAREIVAEIKISQQFGQEIILRSAPITIVENRSRHNINFPIPNDVELHIGQGLWGKVTFHETRSGKKKTLKIGYAFSWSTGKTARGDIGFPIPLWQRLRLWRGY